MIAVADPYLHDVPRQELKPIAEAAKLTGKSRATLFRLLEDGALTRYREKYGRHRTMVDMVELSKLLAAPPGEPVEKPDA